MADARDGRALMPLMQLGLTSKDPHGNVTTQLPVTPKIAYGELDRLNVRNPERSDFMFRQLFGLKSHYEGLYIRQQTVAFGFC